MVDVIEACVSNVDPAVETALQEADASTQVYPCLEHCGYCYRQPFLVVDGDLRTGESLADLVRWCTDG